jgi:hypothetical protein
VNAGALLAMLIPSYCPANRKDSQIHFSGLQKQAPRIVKAVCCWSLAFLVSRNAGTKPARLSNYITQPQQYCES